jgi:mannosyltransferase OCH1-like enzyme
MLVHQVWLQGWNHAPKRVQARVGENARKWGPDATLRLWDDVAIVQLIQLSFPQHLDWYLGLQRVISKCDAARAFILSAFGGVYADCDFDPNPDTIASFAKLSTQRVVFVGSPWYTANNFLIASPPHAPFWTDVFLPAMKQSLDSPSLYDICVSVAWSTWPVMSSSGPVAVGRMLRKRPDLAFALPPSTEYVFGFHGSQGPDTNSSWYRFRAHRIQQLVVLLLVVLACAGLVGIAKEAID